MSSSSPAIFAKPHLAPFPTRRSSDLGLGLDGKRGEDGERDAEEDEQPDATPCNRHDWKNPLERRACSRSHMRDRKSTRLNSSHITISYAVFCLKKKKSSRNSTGLPSD